MRLLFLSHGPLSSNSGLHISALAQALASHGWQSRALVPSVDGTSSTPSDSLPTGLYSQCADLLRSWHPDLVHLWTPRQRIVSLWRQIQQRCPDAVGCLHLEDSEEILTRRSLGWSQADWQTPPQDVRVPAGLTDPQEFRQLLTEIPGVSGLVPTLLEGVPSSMPTCCFAPGFEEGMEWEVAAETKLRQQLGLEDSEQVVVYCGNGHSANREELRSLYLGIALAQEAGCQVRLLRTGNDLFGLSEQDRKIRNRVSVELGVVERSLLPRLLALADLLIQPEHADAFNQQRFPSKLPEFLASGKAVVLPPCNLGLQLKDGQEAILLRKGSALGIRDILLEWLPQKERLRSIGQAGQAYAWQNLRWKFAAETLAEFYHRVLSKHRER